MIKVALLSFKPINRSVQQQQQFWRFAFSLHLADHFGLFWALEMCQKYYQVNS